jgi:hypothetical protein
MTGGKQGAGGPDDPGRKSPPGGQGEGLDVSRLLAGLRAVAKEQEVEMARMPPEVAAPLSAEERGEIATAICEAQARTTGLPPPGDVIPLSSAAGTRRRRLGWIAVVGPLAVAAVLVLAVRMSGTPERPLPAYAMIITGGLKELRGASPAGAVGSTLPVERAGRHTEIVVVCRPEVSVEGPVATRLFLIQGTVAREVQARARTSPSGSVEIRINPVEEGGATAGRWGLRIVVGRPDVVRALPPAAAIARAAGPERWWFHAELEVVDD